MRAAVSAAALVALAVVTGTLAYVSAREDPEAAVATTTSAPAPTTEEVVAAMADALTTGLEAPLTPEEARCVAQGIVATLGRGRLEALAEVAGTATDLDPTERDALVRTVVGCLPETTAAALLGSASTTTVVAALPDEGAGG